MTPPDLRLSGPGDELHGTWTLVASEYDGRDRPDAVRVQLTFVRDTMTTDRGGKTSTADYRVDPSREPKALDLVYHHLDRPLLVRGVYRRDGDTLVICFPVLPGWLLRDTPADREMYETPEATRPTEFRTGPGSHRILITYRREADAGRPGPGTGGAS